MKYILTFMILIALLTSCDREDLAANKMNRGNGTWELNSTVETNYDTTGKVISNTSINLTGEIQFYNTQTLDALYGYYACVFIMNDTIKKGNKKGIIGQFMTDKERINIQNTKTLLDGWWTIDGWGGHKQIWTKVKINNARGSTSPSLGQKTVLTIKKS